MLYIGFYINATKESITVPTDAIAHQEIIIPKLGTDMPNYPFEFSLSVNTD